MWSRPHPFTCWLKHSTRVDCTYKTNFFCPSVRPSVTPAVSGVRRADDQQKIKFGEEFWESEVGNNSDFPTFRLCYSSLPKLGPTYFVRLQFVRWVFWNTISKTEKKTPWSIGHNAFLRVGGVSEWITEVQFGRILKNWFNRFEVQFSYLARH